MRHQLLLCTSRNNILFLLFNHRQIRKWRMEEENEKDSQDDEDQDEL
ncbi:hypothetical protein DICVIV_10695 [Dictyocaulus viviparus]|uniref:Uncharacterized protein n=1 Tax=Dictyocaulus viviparus TaxID=29172 RepID=A0A0D8XHR0_DICVI|nr:hypothetical protein DICVIV_10695 [Dictyocaulus viviparus]